MQFVIYNFKSNVLQKSPGLNVVAAASGESPPCRVKALVANGS